MSGTQAAANALTNLAKAAVGLGFAGSALSASMYNGAWGEWPEQKELARPDIFFSPSIRRVEPCARDGFWFWCFLFSISPVASQRLHALSPPLRRVKPSPWTPI